MEYVGSAYAGFQRQPNKVTVQETLETAITAVTRQETVVTGSGRTDAGAHAMQQVIAFSTDSALPAPVLRRAVNAHLPHDVAISHAVDVPSSFHPRFDAYARIYRYLIWNRDVRSPFLVGRATHVHYPLNDQAMNEAVAHLVGTHDFSAFVSANWTGGRERTVYRAGCHREGDLVTIELAGSGFMKQMVRSIVGTLIRVGSGRMSVCDFKHVLLSRDRSLAGVTAPAAGLYLAGVLYRQVPELNRTSPWAACGLEGNEEKA